MLNVALGVAAVSTVGAPWARYPTLLDLLTNFRLYWIPFLCLLAIVCWLSRMRWSAIIAIGLALFCAGSLLRYSFGKSEATHSAEPLRVVSYNIRESNREGGEILEYLRSLDADIVLLMEISEKWHRRLRALEEVYPYQVQEIRPGAQGMWLLSRHPIGDLDEAGVAESQFSPYISVAIDCPAGLVRFIGIHPSVPIASSSAKRRNEQLKVVREIAAASEVPVVLAGDFNCTPFSGHFLNLLERGRLKDSAIGFGFKNTWHRTWSVLPIDHVLVSKEVIVSNRMLGPRMGSDHHPVIVELHLP